ncbi:SUMF1/EgtB/PvdO family nonheme iron enzyme [Magnetococcales bacterium HHB-1]
MKAFIKEIQERLTIGAYRSPEQVRFSLVAGLLHKLDWDLWNPKQVHLGPEELAISLFPFTPEKPEIVIQVTWEKPLPKESRAGPRAFSPFFILTNGNEWRINYTDHPGQTSDVRIKSLTILEQDLHEIATLFHTFLSYQTHIDGTVKKLIHHQLNRRLPRKDILPRLLPRAQKLHEKNPQYTVGQSLWHLVKRTNASISKEEVRRFLAEQKTAEAEQDHTPLKHTEKEPSPPKVNASAPTSPPLKEKPQPVAKKQEAIIEPVQRQFKYWTESITGMEFVWIEPGSFHMGAHDNEKGRQPNEAPRHAVTLTQGFWIGKYPVTYKQWRLIMEREQDIDAEISVLRQSGEAHDQHEAQKLIDQDAMPAEFVLWEDTQTYIQKLSHMGGAKSKLRLPTEAEWEYAARAGTETPLPFPAQDSLNEYAWYISSSQGVLHKAGLLKPNAWGLYDMLGNVWEWVMDIYAMYESAPATDPKGPNSSSMRNPQHVRRGGSCRSSAKVCRPARRNHVKVNELEAKNSGCLGFRLVRDQEE